MRRRDIHNSILKLRELISKSKIEENIENLQGQQNQVHLQL